MFQFVPVRIHWTLLLFLGVVLLTALPYAATQSGLVAGQFLLFGGLFLTVLAHEFAHAIVARRFGAEVIEVLLTPLGGLTRMRRMPERPLHEGLVAFAGPAVNLVAAALIMIWAGPGPVISQLGAVFGLPAAGQTQATIVVRDATDIVVIIGSINLLLGGLNLFVPGFPMDSGRILRALLTPRLGHLRATLVAVGVGRTVGLIFLLFGLYLLLDSGMLLGGVLIIIALYLQMMAAPEVQHAVARTVFERHAARDGMQTDLPVIGPSTPVSEVQQVLASRQLRGMPVIDEHGRMVGWASLTLVMAESMQGSAASPVRNLMTRYPWVMPGDGLWAVVRRMQDFQINPVPVVEPDGRFRGLITIERLTKMLQEDGPALLGRRA